MMNNLFDPVVADEVNKRIIGLHPDSGGQWGKMTLAQTLAHCTSGLQMAMGNIVAKRAPFPASVLGKLIKPLVLNGDTPMRRNSPSAPELFSADPAQCDFERERTELIAAETEFSSPLTRGFGANTRHRRMAIIS